MTRRWYTARPTWTGVSALFIATILAVLIVGWVGDNNSCLRNHDVRTATRILAMYLDSAANAREQSARHEQHTNPVQARIDSDSATQWRAWAKQVKVRQLQCNKVFPDR
jgi:hypothetical protein